MKKRVFSLMLVVATITGITGLGTQVKADPDLDSVKSKYSEALQKVDAVNEKVSEFDSKIVTLMDKKNTTEKSILDKQNEIAEKQEEVYKARVKLQESEENFKNRVRAVYKNGNDVVVEVLTESKSIGDLIERTQTVREVSKREETIMQTIKVEKDRLGKKKSEFEKEVVTLNTLKDELQKQIDETNKQIESQKTVLAEAESIKNKYATEIKAIEDEIVAKAERVEAAQQSTAIIAQASSVAPTRGAQESATANALAVVEEAKRHLGKAYVWGATGPDTFDCSGLVQYVYRSVGVSLPRTTYDQVKKGTYVPKGQEQPGDLVFFGPNNAPTHVGIYVGNGVYIHAPQENEFVRYDDLSRRRNYCQARRII